MILNNDRMIIINNIVECTKNGEYNKKVEINDPILSNEDSKKIIESYISNKNRPTFYLKTMVAMAITNIMTKRINKDTSVVGLENLPKNPDGLLITSNHFGPLENTVIRHLTNKYLHKKLSIICQVTNFAMTGFIGFIMNYANTIPISTNPRYLARNFPSILTEKIINKKECVLLYPEQEMWFNYRKPRPPKNGAYFYAAKLNFPILSCFVEIIDTSEPENDYFNKTKYKLHVLDVLYPDPNKTVAENIEELSNKDYELKKACYEKVYNKPLDYTFSVDDIAGFKGEI